MSSEKRARQKAGRQQRLEEQQRAEDSARRRSTAIRLGILAVVVIALIALFVFLTRDDGDDSEEVSTDESSTTVPDESGTTAPPPDPIYAPYQPEQYGEGECAPVDGVTEPVLEFEAAPQLCIDPGASYVATFETSAGDVVVELDSTNTPGTVNNFVNLSRFSYYDGTLVHRTDPSIGIVQGGSPHTNNAADPGPGYTIFDEGIGFTYRPGQLVATRTAAPDSAGGQFFFSAADEVSALDSQGTYVVFGEVIEGLEILEAILASHVDDPDDPLGGSPDPEVTVVSITITESDGG